MKLPKERARNNLSKFMLRQAQHERWWRLSCSSYFMHVPKAVLYSRTQGRFNTIDWNVALM